MDPLVEQVCHQESISLIKKSFIASMWFLIIHGLKPPALLLDGKLIVTGKILSKDELVEAIKKDGNS